MTKDIYNGSPCSQALRIVPTELHFSDGAKIILDLSDRVDIAVEVLDHVRYGSDSSVLAAILWEKLSGLHKWEIIQ